MCWRMCVDWSSDLSPWRDHPSCGGGPQDPIEVRVPDLGAFQEIPVIEVHVAPGDTVNADDPLITLETDKASMEVPSPASGTVAEIKVRTGDRVSEGDLI